MEAVVIWKKYAYYVLLTYLVVGFFSIPTWSCGISLYVGSGGVGAF